MIRKVFKKNRDRPRGKIDRFIEKYNLPREYLSINRKSISRGIWIGLFWGFIPMPFQMVGIMALTPFFKFNVPIAMAMVWLSNPFTMPFMYYAEYLTGNLILGWEHTKHIELTMQWFKTNWDHIVVPLYVGAAFYSVVVSTLIYFLINWLWIRSVKEEQKNRSNKPTKENR